MTSRNAPRATAAFIQELERHINEWEEHLIRGNFAPRTVHTRVDRGPRLLVRYLRGENFMNSRR